MGRVVTTPKGGTRELKYGEFTPADRVPDTRPDADDVVLVHADAVKVVQDGLATPRQAVRGRWPAVFPPIPAGYDAWVDIYDSPVAGFGFQVVYEVVRGAKLFRRIVNYGVEGVRESDWFEFIEPGR